MSAPCPRRRSCGFTPTNSASTRAGGAGCGGGRDAVSRQGVVEVLARTGRPRRTAGLLRLHAHELVEHEGVMDTMRALLTEVVTVARAQGIQLDFDERWEAITGLLRRAIGGKASMLPDGEGGRRPRVGVEHGRAGA